ncbi:MAG: lysophospholipid acyltransferase family protein [Halothiobacillus sp.]
MWWVPIRVIRLQWHLARGVWLTHRASHHPPAVHAQRVQNWLAHVLIILNIQVVIEGEPPTECGHLWLANHVSWLDIPLLGGLVPRTVFLAKAEIREWPLIGRLATQAGTLFMLRGTGSGQAQHALTQGLKRNQHVVIFPEGTTTVGLAVKRFHARLIQTALDVPVPVQPVALRYITPDGRLDRRAAYIDNDSLITSLWRILRAKKIQVRVRFLESIPVQPARTAKAAPGLNRDGITRLAEQRIRQALQQWDAP